MSSIFISFIIMTVILDYMLYLLCQCAQETGSYNTFFGALHKIAK
jgi:hypothetical protein